MNSMLCSRCKKRMAVVFVTRMEGEKTFNEGLCLQCAKELGIKEMTQEILSANRYEAIWIIDSTDVKVINVKPE